MTDWKRLGDPSPDALTDTLLQLHWGAQPLAWFGEGLTPHFPDYRQRALVWEPTPARDGVGRMRSAGSSATGLALAFPLEGFRLQLLGSDDAPLSGLSLEGATLDDAERWLRDAVTGAGENGSGIPRLGTDRLPEAPPGAGAVFHGGSPAARSELTRWFSNASGLLEAARAGRAGARPVLTWPHHFDIATLIVVEENPDPEKVRSVGVGMAPGDGSYPEPYFYVTPWPYPEPKSLPGLPAGHWHTEGWVGAVLPARALVAEGDAAGQRRLAEAFVAVGVDAAVSLVR